MGIGIGLIYALVYGFWTMLATGGGHGNFVWVLLFIFVELFGIYFPVMGAMIADLGSRFTKIIFGSLILFNVLASIVLLSSWIFEATGDSSDDFERMWGRYPGTVILCAFMHFLPSFVFTFFLIRAILFGSDEPNDGDSVLTLGLN